MLHHPRITPTGDRPYTSLAVQETELTTKQARPQSLDQVFDSLHIDECLRLGELVSQASRGRGGVGPLLEELQSPTRRDRALAMLIHRNDEMTITSRRTAVLREILEFSDEMLVKEYALRTLQAERFENCERVVVAAAHIILKAGPTLTDKQIASIASIASLVGDKDEPLAASAAEYILHHLPPSPTLISCSKKLAHDWFLSYRGRGNPWLSILSKYPTWTGFELLKDVATGVVPHERTPSPAYQVVKVALSVHSAAALTGTVGVVINSCLAWAGVWGRIGAVQAFILSASALYVAKAAWKAVLVWDNNWGRDYERVEALAHLSIMRERARHGGGVERSRLWGEIDELFSDTCNDPAQRPFLREAAYCARIDAFQPSDLWEKVAAEQ